MLKFTYVVQLGLLGAVALPVVLQESGSLEQALAQAERALTELVEAQDAAQDDPRAGVELALATTERPLGTPQDRDELLERLRQDVGRLQEELDELEVRDATGSALAGGSSSEGGGGAGAVGTPEWTASAGLDDRQRELLGAIRPPLDALGSPHAPSSGPRIALEEPGYTADALRHGRAYVRAGRHAEALELLELAEDRPEARYWRARCLERLGRPDEALALYEALAREKPGTKLGERAAREHEFLAWLRAFEARLAERRQP